MQALNGANEPDAKAVLRPVRRPHENDPGCLDEEHGQVAVAALGEPSEDSPVSSRHLFGHEAEPSRIIPPFRKGRSIADSGNHGARDDRADTRHSHHPPTIVVSFRQCLDFISHSFNSIIELPPVAGKITDDAYHAWGKHVRSLGQNVGQQLAKEPRSLPNDYAALQEKA